MQILVAGMDHGKPHAYNFLNPTHPSTFNYAKNCVSNHPYSASCTSTYLQWSVHNLPPFVPQPYPGQPLSLTSTAEVNEQRSTAEQVSTSTSPRDSQDLHATNLVALPGSSLPSAPPSSERSVIVLNFQSPCRKSPEVSEGRAAETENREGVGPPPLKQVRRERGGLTWVEIISDPQVQRISLLCMAKKFVPTLKQLMLRYSMCCSSGCNVYCI